MHCESCGATITPNMRGALSNNSCPFCSGEIMEPAKAEQYSNLLNVLDRTTFTNREDVDGKIRSKVASLMINNFIFMLTPSSAEEDIVVLDEEQLDNQVDLEVATPQDYSNTVSKATKKKTKKTKKTTSKKASKKSKKQSDSVQKTSSTGKKLNEYLDLDPSEVQPRTPEARDLSAPSNLKVGGLTMQDFMGAQQDIYEGSSSAGSMLSQPTISAEEVMSMFPNMTPEQALEAVRNDASVLENLGQPKKGLTGQGIKRLNK